MASHKMKIKARVTWTGFRGSGEPYEPHEGLRPQSRFPSVHEFDGKHGSWDMRIEETLEYGLETRCSVLLLSMGPRAPVHVLKEGDEFMLMDGRKEIAQGEIIALDDSTPTAAM